jgi:hypothetical protein
MENAWSPTERLVADRHDAFEMAARRQRIVSGGRVARRFTLRRRRPAPAAHMTPTTGRRESFRVA